MSAQRCERAVNLLGQNGSGEFVRHRQGGERQQEVGAVAPRLRQAVMPSNDEDQIAARHFGFGEQICEGGGVDRASRGIEQYFLRTRMFGAEVGIGFDFGHACGRVAVCALNVVRGERVGVKVFGFADVIEEKLHSAGIGTSFASRHSRSSE